ncbi:MAG: hypothetical protein HPM95_10600 [Alphaproteobacteria bacterium]|nr:hypothetical protein [Alphaproteobacteria bacterium]
MAWGRAATGRQGAETAGNPAGAGESFERIHRANLIGMGILPLVFDDGARRRPSV